MLPCFLEELDDFRRQGRLKIYSNGSDNRIGDLDTVGNSPWYR